MGLDEPSNRGQAVFQHLFLTDLPWSQGPKVFQDLLKVGEVEQYVTRFDVLKYFHVS